MNKKLRKFIEPSMKMYFVILVFFAAGSLFFNVRLAAVEGAVILLLLVYSLIIGRKRRGELAEYIESITYNVESAQNNTLMNFPLPIVVFKLNDYQMVWANRIFFSMCGKSIPTFDANLTDLVPGFSGKWLLEGKTRQAGVIEVSGRKYQIHGNIIRANSDERSKDFMGVTYWVDVTEFDDVKLEYQNSRPVVMIIVVDNYDELMKNVSDRIKAELRATVDERIEQWLGGKDGLLNRYDRDRYVFVFEERFLTGMTDDKFSILDSVRKVVNPSGIHATLSIGIGKDGAGFEENYRFASLSIDMALSRGGDQIVLKNRFSFEFFGGRGTEIETRTKVKSRVMANALYQLIGDSSQVFIMGHQLADMDCVGAAAGMCCICRKRGIRAYIVINPVRNASHKLISLLCREAEYENAFISPQEAMLKADGQSLLVVTDTNRPEQVEDQNLLQACNRVVVIDHHRRAASYIQNAALSLHEPYASSVCELMAELLQELTEQSDIMRCEAEAVMAGIVMDTKNFMIRTGERTFEAAAFLRRAGADTEEVKKLMQNDIENTVARYNIMQRTKLYHGNIAVAAPETPQDRIVAAQAADELLNISGIQASVVIYPTEDGGVVISARSIGDINVQLLLEEFGGGGNKSAAGAQVKDISLRDAVNKMFKTIDAYLGG
ncbi:MAG: DHH family phosphoesterase [Oscillospiraceae bacterium]|nr:DHH family phosphoesterase [Oscillospiraceae bacterium]